MCKFRTMDYGQIYKKQASEIIYSIKKMKKEMFYNAIALIFHNVRELRSRPAEAETVLWNYLRGRPGGYKFRRQHPSGNYVLDFYCHTLKLAIEADGAIHNEKDIMHADIERQKTWKRRE